MGAAKSILGSEQIATNCDVNLTKQLTWLPLKCHLDYQGSLMVTANKLVVENYQLVILSPGEINKLTYVSLKLPSLFQK